MDGKQKELIAEMRTASRFPSRAWHFVIRALVGKYCETFGDTVETIKAYFVKQFGDEARSKMEECGLATVKDIKDILSMLGEQGVIEFDTLADSPDATLWAD